MATIVAEAGIAHNGNHRRAVRLAYEAHKAGADYVKFQMFYCFPRLESFELEISDWFKVFARLDALKIPWFCTAFDFQSIVNLAELGMKTWKIPSNPKVVGDKFLLRYIARDVPNEHTIISTGISNDDQISEMLDIFSGRKITLLYCVSKYPCSEEDVHLERIYEMREKFKVPVGFSDHTTSIKLPADAVLLYGATMIEKHVTLDRNQGLPDDPVSLEMDEFSEMVSAIRIRMMEK